MSDALLVILIFGGGLALGGWLTGQALRYPRYGLSAALFLAAWLVLTLAVAMPTRWHALLGDGGLLLLVIAAGGLTWQRKAPLRPALPPLDAAFFGLVLLGFSVPALALPVPLDTDAQGFGYLALMARLHGDLSTLAPFHPEIDYLYAPGFTVIVAYLSERLGTPLHSTQFAAGAVLSTLLVWVLYDMGTAFRGRGLGRAQALAVILGVGLITAYMDSHYTSLLGLAIGGAFLTFIYDYMRAGRWPDALGAALMLAALVLAHPDTTIIVGLGFGAWLLLMPLGTPRPTPRRWLVMALGVPLAALLLITPWLFSVLHLLGSGITSPFSRDPAYWRIVLAYPPELLYHGGLIIPFALAGALIGLLRRQPSALLALGWLLLILEFAAFGLLEHIAPALIAPIVRYDYPFSIAWHGPIIPYALLGGVALLAIWNRASGIMPVAAWRRLAWGGLAVGAVLLVLAGLFNREVLAFSKGRLTFFGAFASHADVQAMSWLRENTPADALILNFPGPQEGDWVPVIAERRSVYYRPQPFFKRGDADPLADTPQQLAFRAFWEDPANPDHAGLLAAAGVDYVIVPQVVGNPASFAGHYRWRQPFTDMIPGAGGVVDAPYLDAVFNADGAIVFAFCCSAAP